MFEISDTRQSPYSSICYIRCTWADGSMTRASAVVVGLNDVLTALHAVYDPQRGGFAQKIAVFPGADTSPFFNAPFGEFSVRPQDISARAPTWDDDGDGLLTPAESAVDLALLGLGTRIGSVTGWLPVTNLPLDFTGLAVGYPARGTGQMAQQVFADASSWYGVYDLSMGLGAGASGGPLLYSAGGVTSVVGVLSAGDSAHTTSTYAGLFGPGTWDWLRGAMDANDTLIGLAPGAAPDAGPRVYMGTGGNDSYVGTAGRDVFTGLAGDDSFDGGDGLDTAVFSGTRGSHNVQVLSAAQVRVVDTVPWRDGTDMLTNVERIRFDDFSMAFDVRGAAGQAYRLYKAAFDRAPDLAGLGYQINALDAGLPLWHVGNHFTQSPEFLDKYGAADDRMLVTLLYRNVLAREPASWEVDFHVGRIAAGVPRGGILEGFSESPENQLNVIGQIQGGMLFIPV